MYLCTWCMRIYISFNCSTFPSLTSPLRLGGGRRAPKIEGEKFCVRRRRPKRKKMVSHILPFIAFTLKQKVFVAQNKVSAFCSLTSGLQLINPFSQSVRWHETGEFWARFWTTKGGRRPHSFNWVTDVQFLAQGGGGGKSVIGDLQIAMHSFSRHDFLSEQGRR